MAGHQRLKSRCVKCDSKSFGLTHEPPEDFLLSQWCDHPVPYAILRSVFALYAVAIVIYTGIESGHGNKIVIWLTYWSYYVLTASFVVSAGNTWAYWLYDYHRRKRDFVRSPWFLTSLKIQWFLFILASGAAPLISALFWAVVYEGNGASFVTINTHGVNLVLVLIDFVITRCPMRIHHFYMSSVYCATYAIFNVIYWAAGGTNHHNEPYIYSVLDYDNNLKKALIFLFSVTLLVAPLIHCVLYAGYRLRRFVHSRCLQGVEKEQESELEKLSTEI